MKNLQVYSCQDPAFSFIAINIPILVVISIATVIVEDVELSMRCSA